MDYKQVLQIEQKLGYSPLWANKEEKILLTPSIVPFMYLVNILFWVVCPHVLEMVNLLTYLRELANRYSSINNRCYSYSMACSITIRKLLSKVISSSYYMSMRGTRDAQENIT